jgi:DNA-binding NarL/FixJ family response regulator
MPSEAIPVYVADPERGLMGVLAEVLPRHGVQVEGHAVTEDEAFEGVLALRPRVVVTAIELERGHGLELLRRLRSSTRVSVLVLSGLAHPLYARQALALGARGYLRRNFGHLNDLVEAIRTVAAGRLYLDAVSRGAMRELPDISFGELRVLEALGEGLAPGEVCRRLGMNAATVESHQRRLIVKLELASCWELRRVAARWMLFVPRGAALERDEFCRVHHVSVRTLGLLVAEGVVQEEGGGDAARYVLTRNEERGARSEERPS